MCKGWTISLQKLGGDCELDLEVDLEIDLEVDGSVFKLGGGSDVLVYFNSFK